MGDQSELAVYRSRSARFPLCGCTARVRGELFSSAIRRARAFSPKLKQAKGTGFECARAPASRSQPGACVRVSFGVRPPLPFASRWLLFTVYRTDARANTGPKSSPRL